MARLFLTDHHPDDLSDPDYSLDSVGRALRMPKDKRSRGYVEMMGNADAGDDDCDYTDVLPKRFQSADDKAREQRFRDAAKAGAHCGRCGKLWDSPAEPVWQILHEYDSDVKVDLVYDSGSVIYETEEVVAPICSSCWGKQAQTRIPMTGPCGGCGRPVNLTPGALKAWLRHGKKIYCCEDCFAAPRPAITAEATQKCPGCGEEFTPKRFGQKTCGKAACQKRLARAKNI